MIEDYKYSIVLNQFAKMRDFLIFMTNNKIVLYYNRSK